MRGDWNVAPLGELVDFVGGGTPSRTDPSYWGGPIPWATVKDFKGPALTRTAESITEAGLRSSSARVIRRGTVVMPTRMALGKVAVAELDVAINQDLKALHPRRPLDTRFLLHALLARAPQIEARGAGATVKGITINDLGRIEIGFPGCEPEQRRIAAILDMADAIRARRCAAIRDADALLRATFFHLFGDPVINPRGWAVRRLDDGIADIRSGVTKGRKPNGAPVRALPYMRVANVQDGHIDLSDVKTIDVTEAEATRFALQAGDVLLTEGGDPDKLGRGAVWRGEIDECIHQNHIFAVRLQPDAGVCADYLSTLIGSAYGKRYFLRHAKQTTGIATINRTQLAAFPVLVPAPDVLERWRTANAAAEAARDQAKVALADADALYTSLAARAFRGEL